MDNVNIKSSKIWKKILGAVLVFFGLLALVTPLTPGSWLAVIGLELLGVRILFFDNVKKFFRNLLSRLNLKKHTYE